MPPPDRQDSRSLKALRALHALRACRDGLQARGQRDSAYQVGVLVQLPTDSLASLAEAFEHAFARAAVRSAA